jgi:hypothetical protein
MIYPIYIYSSGARTFLAASILPFINTRLQPGVTDNLKTETVSTVSRTPLKPEDLKKF